MINHTAWLSLHRFGTWLHQAIAGSETVPPDAPWVRLKPELKFSFMQQLLADECAVDAAKFKKVGIRGRTTAPDSFMS